MSTIDVKYACPCLSGWGYSSKYIIKLLFYNVFVQKCRKNIYFELYPHPEKERHVYLTCIVDIYSLHSYLAFISDNYIIERHAYLTSIVDIYSLHSYLTFLSDISICNCPPRSAVGQLSLEAKMKT